MSTNKGDHGNSNLEAAVRYFAKCRSKVVVRGNLELQGSLATVIRASDETGLEPQHITSLLDAAASGHFAQSVSRQLIRSLVPRTVVSQEAIVKAVSWMSTNKPPVAIQSLLLRWILVVYDYIDGYDQIHRLYGILFLFLDSQTLLPHLCHLLFLLTRKEDVKMFRVRKLLSLVQGRVGSQSCIIGLLTIYKLYYPNLVSFALPSSNRMFFGSYDRKWKSTVREVVEKWAKEGQGQGSLSLSHGDNATQLSVSKSRQLASRPPPKKRRRLEVPIAHSSSADVESQESANGPSSCLDTKRVPYVRVDSFVDLLQNVDKIEFPSQIAACLRDPVLQHLMAYAGDRVVTARFTFWLQHALTEEFLNHKPANLEENEQLLKMLVDLIDFLQEGIPVVDNFLASFLHTWNGVDYGPLIFRLISKCQMYSFNDLNDLILEPLRQLYFSSSLYFKCQCLLTLTELMVNYATFEIPRLKAWTAVINLDEQTQTCLVTNPELCILFPERMNETIQVYSVMEDLTSFIEKLAVVGLQVEGNNVLLLHVINNYIHSLTLLAEAPCMDQVIVPSSHLVHFVLFSSSTSAISRLAGSFCRFKEAFGRVAYRRRDRVGAFNEILVDMCDALWRNKVFSNPTQGTMKAIAADVCNGLLALDVPSPSSCFSIFQGKAFLAYAWTFFVETQPSGKKVHPNQLKSFKDIYLQFLSQHHLSGIVSFINTFIIRKTTPARALEN